MVHRHKKERGAIDGWMLSTIGLIILCIGAGSLAIWAYLNYQEQKTNVDGKVDVAVAEAVRDQTETLQASFLEEEKKPNEEFAGPEDYGLVSFMYPKTWSVYVARDASSGGNYEAYLHPVVVPPVSNTEQFALRVLIETKDYDTVVSSYERRITDGKLRSSTFAVNGETGVRLDGNFTDDIRGSAVIFKVRDKTVTLRSDADTFRPDFDALIATVKFNQ